METRPEDAPQEVSCCTPSSTAHQSIQKRFINCTFVHMSCVSRC